MLSKTTAVSRSIVSVNSASGFTVDSYVAPSYHFVPKRWPIPTLFFAVQRWRWKSSRKLPIDLHHSTLLLLPRRCRRRPLRTSVVVVNGGVRYRNGVF